MSRTTRLLSAGNLPRRDFLKHCLATGAVPLTLSTASLAQAVEKVPPAKGRIQPPTEKWISKIRELAPAGPRVEPKQKRRVLLFSLTTGYRHAVIPHAAAVVKILSETSGAFEVIESNDIEMFLPGKLKGFDAVILNNNCSIGPGRNMFLDVLNNAVKGKNLGDKYKDLTPQQRKTRAAELEESLLGFVQRGKGLVGIHGAITMLNNSEGFGELFGGSFAFHARRQDIALNPVEPDHPLLAAFKGESFVHNDEPFVYKNAYSKKNFRPLLEIDVSKLTEEAQARLKGDVRYVSWIKKYGKGRVFFVEPSHQPESYESARMLQFYLDGIQYVLGDFQCDDSPKGDKTEGVKE